MKYLKAAEILQIHAMVIESTGGSHGLRDLGLLESAAARPRVSFDGVDMYDDVFTKAAALLESLAKNHPFNDGNKRTAAVSTARFLAMNGLEYAPPQGEIEALMLDVVKTRPNLESIAVRLKKFC